MGVLTRFTIKVSGEVLDVQIPDSADESASARTKLDRWQEGKDSLKGQITNGKELISLGKELGPKAIVLQTV